MKFRIFVFSVLAVLSLTDTAKGEPPMIDQGKTVKFDYTLTVDGQEVDSSQRKGPLEYVHGQGWIIPGLEKRLEGMKVGDQRSLVIPPDEAYGQVDPQAFQEVSKTLFPQDFQVEKGMVLPLQDQEGHQVIASVTDIKPESVVLNLNHPLAGKELKFDVKVVDIQ